MSKKTFELVVGITGGVAAIAVAVVTFAKPTYCVAINGAIAIAQTAVTEILTLFTKKE